MKSKERSPDILTETTINSNFDHRFFVSYPIKKETQPLTF
jgi:hypothetical protein